jgi:PEP-CTERM motif
MRKFLMAASAVALLLGVATSANATTLLVKTIGVMDSSSTANITIDGSTEEIYNTPQVFTLNDGKVVDLVNCVLPAGINSVGGQNPPLTYTSESGALYFNTHGGDLVGEQVQYLVDQEKGASLTTVDDITTAINEKLGVQYNSPVDAAAAAFAASTNVDKHIGLVFTSSDLNGQAVMLGNGVPEPATWATMLLGFGAIGATMRSRRRQLALATATAA